MFTVLSRVKAFLPEMESANRSLEEALREQPASDFDIEHVEEGDAHIQMVRRMCGIGGSPMLTSISGLKRVQNLMLGLLEESKDGRGRPVDEAGLTGLIQGLVPAEDEEGGAAPMVEEM